MNWFIFFIENASYLLNLLPIMLGFYSILDSLSEGYAISIR